MVRGNSGLWAGSIFARFLPGALQNKHWSTEGNRHGDLHANVRYPPMGAAGRNG